MFVRRENVKKISSVLIIISSIGIILGGILSILNSSFYSREIVGISFIVLGAGTIAFGIQMLKSNHNG